ncbi:hypothetical protein CS022_22655 [Veronia nyctiphanis]|uniref:HTH cro/C1-type domain-containing protein n=1 Tax=Veronia nyctiphanis TaxID=1278244 RepID=A0A4Q0YMX5_9GAMM|nr:S24 family peptidase [Veronia nyctiphanis]RXJ70669.1 hypothetical protein CS022_22655 [Veronia nyctiphanis]
MDIKEERIAFSTRLNAILDTRGFAPKQRGRQTKLAEKFNLTQKGVRRWLEGESIPRIDSLRTLSEEFDVNIEWLHYGNGPISAFHKEVGSRVKQARDAKGWTEAELASRLQSQAGDSEVIKVAGVRAIESGRRMEFAPDLSMYADVLQVSLSWLETGLNLVVDASAAEIESDEGAMVSVPKLSALASMGQGIPIELEHDRLISTVSISKQWINEHLPKVSSVDNLAMITGYGDSMEGTFNHGDMLFVDTGVDDFIMDAVYVLDLNGQLYIKRLQMRPDGVLLMISDNPKYQPYEINPEEKTTLRVLGRVVGCWSFRGM